MNERQGQHGLAKPAFTVHRFKRTIILVLNEEMGEALNEVLERDEKNRGNVQPFQYEFTSQLQEALDQPPPARGEKPATLAPGRRPRQPVVKAVS